MPDNNGWNDDRNFSNSERNPYREFLPASNNPSQASDSSEGDSPGTIIGDNYGNDYEDSTASNYLIVFVCWSIILGIVGLILFLQNQATQFEPEGEIPPRVELANILIQGQVLVGLKSATERLADQPEEQDFEILGGGSVRNYLAKAILTAELNSREEAVDVVDNLTQLAVTEGYEISDEESDLIALVRRIVDSQEVPEVSEAEKKLLRTELPWFGELALHLKPATQELPPELKQERKNILTKAEPKFVAFGATILFGGVCFLVGIVGFLSFSSMYSRGRLELRTPERAPRSSVYLEGFTAWLGSFVLLGLTLPLIDPNANPLIANVGIFLASLIIGFVWTLVRGTSFAEICTAIGWHGNPVSEGVWAVWCYICALPILCAGFALTLYLLASSLDPTAKELAGPSGPGHPIMQFVMEGDPTTIFWVYIVACVCAPIIEETFFRGFLYRWLRTATSGAPHVISMLFSALVNAVIFAAIHPQGVLFIPALGALAVSFSLMREWRGSLWGPIVMHAIHNGILTSALVFFLVS